MTVSATIAAEVSTGRFIERSRGKSAIREGREVRPVYHVTEVKAARFSSLDCGAMPEDWSKTVLQILDIEGDRPCRSANSSQLSEG